MNFANVISPATPPAGRNLVYSYACVPNNPPPLLLLLPVRRPMTSVVPAGREADHDAYRLGRPGPGEYG